MFTEVTDDEFRENWTGLGEDKQNSYEIKYDIGNTTDEDIIETFEKNRFTYFTNKINDFNQSELKRGFLFRREDDLA